MTPKLPYAWSSIAKTIAIHARMFKKLNVLGFLNINNSKLFASTTYDRVDTAVLIEVLNLFVKQLTKNTIVVVDNTPVHTSKKFKEHIKIWEEKGLRIFYLAPYSLQLYWIKFDAYKSTENMKNYVEKNIIALV